MADINSFTLAPEQGQLDLQVHSSVVSCAVSASETGTLVAGQAVKIENSAGGVPKVLALTANTEATFGFVVRNLKDVNRAAGEALEVAMKGSIMFMKAGAAIARGAKVEVVYTTNKVITSAGVNPVIGWAYDKAAADGDLIRVFIETPAVVQPASQMSIALDDLSDVVLATVTNGQVLKYDGTDARWENAADAT